ncbi:MAG: hypothetical protein RSF79_19735 [Janthinobacterium sp.]
MNCATGRGARPSKRRVSPASAVLPRSSMPRVARSGMAKPSSLASSSTGGISHRGSGTTRSRPSLMAARNAAR